MSEYDIRTVGIEDVILLRSALLDPTASGTPTRSPGDEHPEARHVGAFVEEMLVGVGSIHPQGMPGGYSVAAWRLTGVAVDHGHRGLGVGALLVERCLEHAATAQAKVVWCLAPAGVFGFFERYGFRRSGDPSTGTHGGPEYLLYAELGPLTRSWAI